jgi:hypothetical protein
VRPAARKGGGSVSRRRVGEEIRVLTPGAHVTGLKRKGWAARSKWAERVRCWAGWVRKKGRSGPVHWFAFANKRTSLNLGIEFRV